MKRFVHIMVVAALLAAPLVFRNLSIAATVYKLWLCDGLTGAAATDLDGIPSSGTTAPPNGAFANVMISGSSEIYFFQYDSGATGENQTAKHPYTVIPSDLPTTGLWTEIYVVTLQSVDVQGLGSFKSGVSVISGITLYGTSGNKDFYVTDQGHIFARDCISIGVAPSNDPAYGVQQWETDDADVSWAIFTNKDNGKGQIYFATDRDGAVQYSAIGYQHDVGMRLQIGASISNDLLVDLTGNVILGGTDNKGSRLQVPGLGGFESGVSSPADAIWQAASGESIFVVGGTLYFSDSSGVDHALH